MKTKSKTEQANSEKGMATTANRRKKSPGLKSNDFPIIGIGASAGGLEALEQFFGNMPKNPGIAFVVVQHLDPTHVGIMPELLQRITTLKVLQVTDGLKVKPNCVYVIPPNKSMSMLNGSLHLFEPVEMRGRRLPIDIFFRSMADDRKEKAIGIILSGMGSDGSIGAKAIKDMEGIMLVQDPKSAKFDGMPHSAIDAVVADIVGAAEELPEKLIAFLKYTPVIISDSKLDSKNSSNIDKIIILLREQTGHDFSMYKKNTLFRRIERRKNVHQIDNIQSYVRYIQEHPQEIEVLFKELLIGVTNFFRDEKLWDMLKESTLPAMLKEMPNGHVVRVWVPACSTGEEAFSYAIIFKEVMEEFKMHKNITLQVFATDLDADAVEKARKGFFASSIVSDVSPERISRFFTAEGEGYRINATIREMVIFAPQNVIKDPPFTKLDILSCRNMLIYMEPELQIKLTTLFNYSLNPGGIMVLGTSETLGVNVEGFKELNNKLKIYKRTATVSPAELFDFPSAFYNKRDINIEDKIQPKATENTQVLVDQLIIQQYSPASVLVNPKGDIIYITGRTGKYLEPVAGKANWNIHAMAREGLSTILPTAFRNAMKSFDPVLIEKIKVGINGGTQFVDLTIRRIEKPESIKGMILVVFKDVQAEVEHEKTTTNVKPRSSSKKVNELEIELQRSHEEMQSTREEMQTSQEELKSTNEELQSTNEELQSTNEELTTSKEEMQSLNEELQTVNLELQSKVTDFVRANDDMKNLLNSTEIATLFLDKNMHIRRFTNQLVDIFKIRDIDIGRPFTDLVNKMNYPEMDEHARKVIKTLISVETDIATSNERWFTVRIMPYRTLDDRIDGLVVTFSEITVAKKLEIELKRVNESLR